MKDKLQTNEFAEVVFSDVKTKMAKVLGSPLLPEFVSMRLSPVLARTRMLPDEEFEAEVRKTAVSNTAEADLMFQREVAPLNACLFPDDSLIFRLSYVRDDPYARYFLQDLMAEEISHCLREPKSVPLPSVPDGSLLIAPFGTKQELLEELRQTGRKFELRTANTHPENIAVLISGFQSLFQDRETGAKYLKYKEQVVLEESRAALIQTFLEALYGGICLVPFESPERQYHVGMTVLLNNVKKAPQIYLREYAALIFIAEYRKRFKNEREFLEAVLTKLYRDNVQEFVEHLNEEERKKFRETVRLMGGEFVIRYLVAEMKMRSTTSSTQSPQQ